MKQFIRFWSIYIFIILLSDPSVAQPNTSLRDTIWEKSKLVGYRIVPVPSRFLDTSPAQALEPIRYYQNSDNNTIQAPTHYNKPPQGATALCRDGSYSFSRHRQGTCFGAWWGGEVVVGPLESASRPLVAATLVAE